MLTIVELIRRTGASDWPDIFDLLRTCEIDVAGPEFRTLVVRYGGEEALKRMKRGRFGCESHSLLDSFIKTDSHDRPACYRFLLDGSSRN